MRARARTKNSNYNAESSYHILDLIWQYAQITNRTIST